MKFTFWSITLKDAIGWRSNMGFKAKARKYKAESGEETETKKKSTAKVGEIVTRTAASGCRCCADVQGR